MKIELIKITELKAADYNPRVMPEEELGKLKRSITEFGFIEPVVVNSNPQRLNVIIGGHQRVEAARQLGMTEVPVVFLSLDVAKEKILNIALNRIHGSWDEVKLATLFTELGLDGSVDILLAGFDTAEIDKILDKVNSKSEFDPEKEAAAIKDPVSKAGEVYELGPHRLICGDSTVLEDFEKLMGGKKAKVCFTSPPYNMGNQSLYADYDDNLPSREYIEFNLSIVRNVQQHLKGFLFWNMSYNKNSRWEWIEVFHRIIKETDFRFLECIVWDKGHGLPVLSKDALTRQYENILVAENQDDPKDIDFVFIGANQKAVFHKGHKKKLTNYWYFSTQNTQIEGHGACFPVELPKRAIELMTDRGDIVLDPFGGSGSTLIAAEQCGRVAYLVEKSPLFCDVIRKRYEQYTKQS